MGANLFHRVESLSFMVLCVYENLELFFFSFVFTSAVLITEAANCKAINHVCMDNNPRKSTPKSGALRNLRRPLYTFVFIILWPFHELVSIGGWKLLTRLCRRNSSAECKSEFMMKNTKSFFRLLELPSVAHCCAGKCLLIEAYEWGRKKMLNIIHRFYACVGTHTSHPAQIAWWWNAVPRTKSQRVSRVRREVLYPARDDFLSGFARLSHENVYTRHRQRSKNFSQHRAARGLHCSLFSDFDFLLPFISTDVKRDLNQIELAFPACALSRTFDIYHLFTGEKIPALWQTSLDCVCETNVCAPDEIRISSYFRDWRSAENTTGEEEKKRHNRLIFRCAGGEWVDYVLWLFARLRHLAVAWVVDVFPPDFRRLYA